MKRIMTSSDRVRDCKSLYSKRSDCKSARTGLNHEADHALRELTDPIQKKKDLMRIDVQYGNAEERRVIEGSEQRTAYKHGEIEEGEITRNNHNGYRYEMNSSITTVGVLEW